MMRTVASCWSGCINDLPVLENMVAVKRISQPLFFHKIHLSPENLLQLILHVHHVKQTPGRIGGEVYQRVDVAVGRRRGCLSGLQSVWEGGWFPVAVLSSRLG